MQGGELKMQRGGGNLVGAAGIPCLESARGCGVEKWSEEGEEQTARVVVGEQLGEGLNLSWQGNGRGPGARAPSVTGRARNVGRERWEVEQPDLGCETGARGE